MNLPFNTRLAFRQIWKNRTISLLNIFGLAFSIACCIVIGFYVFNQLTFDSFHEKRERIYRVTETQKQPGGIFHAAVTPGPLAPALLADFPELANVVRIGKWSGTFKIGNKTIEEKELLLTEPSFFDVFAFPLLVGNENDLLKTDQDMVITEAAAIRYFGKDWRTTKNLIGSVFNYNDERQFRLAGVVRNPPANSSITFSILLPIHYLFASDEWSYKWNSNNYHTYIELKPSVNRSLLEEKIKGELKKYNQTEDLLSLQPLGKQYLYSKFDFNTDWGLRSDIKYVRIFSAVGLILLIIACVNFINLSTAGSMRRAVEVGVRKVNGASRRQLIIQFLGESLLMAGLSGFLGLSLISLAQPYVRNFTGFDLQFNFLDPVVLILVVCFVILVGLLAGLYPDVFLSSFKPINILKSGQRLSGAKQMFSSLVIFQFVISISLIISAVFMYQQLNLVRSKDLGFDKGNLVNIRLNGQLRKSVSNIKRDIGLDPGIVSVSPATMTLVDVNNTSNFKWDGMRPGDDFLITQANVHPDFLSTAGMTLLAGKNFSEQLTNDTANFILNETAVRRMGFTNETVLGLGLEFWGAKGKVIGVVRDFNFKPLSSAIEPFVLRYQPMDGYFTLFVRLRAGNIARSLASVLSILKKYEGELPPEYTFVNESLGKLYENDQHTANMILLFSCLTVFVGCLGLFGLSLIVSQQRMREIAIRKVLGAGFGSLAIILSVRFVRLIAVACLIAMPLGYLMVRSWLQDFAYRVDINLLLIAAVAGAVILLVVAIMLAQANRATRANPILALRKN